MPAVELHAKIQFSRLPEADKEEAVAESVAAAFCGYASACQRGNEQVIRPSTLAHFSVLHAKSGRHVGGSSEGKTDVMSRVAQRRHGFRVFGLPLRDRYPLDCMTAPDQPVWRDRLQLDRRTSPADLACFRIDWSTFMAGQTDRTRTLLGMLGSGYRSVEIADHLGVTASAVCQRRSKARQEWANLQGDDPGDEAAEVARGGPGPGQACQVTAGPSRPAA